MEIDVEKLMDFKEAIVLKYSYHTIIFFFFLAKPAEDLSIKEKKVLEARYFDLEEIENLNLVDTARWALEKLKSIDV